MPVRIVRTQCFLKMTVCAPIRRYSSYGTESVKPQ